MQFRKTLISCAMLVLCCFSFASCAAMGAALSAEEEEQRQREGGPSDYQPSTYIEANGFAYGELDLETIQNLKLSVESCDGLTEIGKISGGNISRTELFDDTRSTATGQRIRLKNKKDYTALPEAAQFDKIIYAHPNPAYPNLVVARIDGEPAIFQFYCCARGKGLNIDAAIRDVYGVTAPEKIQAVRIAYYTKLSSEYEAQKTTITDRAELEAFFDAISELFGKEPTYIDYSDPTKEYPWYDCRIELANGFSFGIGYNPQHNEVCFIGGNCEGNEALAAWLESHAKK